MKKQLFTLLTLLVMCVTGAWADDALTITYAYDKINATGTGSASVANTMSVMSVGLVGSYQSFNGTGNAATYNSVSVPAYSRISVSNDGTTSTSDYVRFTITPIDGCTFTPTSVSLGAIREGTDGGSMYVYANGTALQEKTLKKSPVAPGRNKTGETAEDITKYTKDGYTFSYNISETTATASDPLYVDVCMSGLRNKSWGLWNVVITGTYVKEDVTTYNLTTEASPAAGGNINRNPNQISYQANKSVTLTAIPNYGYEFVNWTKNNEVVSTNAAYAFTTVAAEETYVAHFNQLDTYALTVSSNNNAYGTVKKSPDHDAYIANEEVTLNATPKTGYAFINWTKDNEVVSTSASYTFNTSTTASAYVANFVQLYSVTFNVESGNRGSSNTGFTTQYANVSNKWTAPINYYAASEGLTLTKWTDGTNDYIPGTEYTLTGNITITPVFENKGNLNDLEQRTTVSWPFGSQDSAPKLSSEGNTQYYVQRVTIAGVAIDVPIFVNTEQDYGISGKKGKFDGRETYAQVNAGTVFKIPAIDGMEIKYVTNQESAVANIGFTDDASKLGDDGSNLTKPTEISSDKKTITYTYSGSANYLYLVDINGNKYPESLSVTYPSKYSVYRYAADDALVELTKTNINGKEYLAVTTNNWNSDKSYDVAAYGTISGDFYNLSSVGRNLTIKVTGVSAFEVLVQNGTDGRTYDVQIGSADAVTVTHGGNGVESSGIFEISDPSATTTITIKGKGNSVYPVAIRFNHILATVGTYGYATFSSTFDLDFDGINDVTPLIVTNKNNDGTAIVLQPVTGKIAAGTGLILKGTVGITTNVAIPMTSEASTKYDSESATKNYLFAIDQDDYELNASGNGTNYILTVQSEKVVFAPIGGISATLYAGQAALWIPTFGPARSLMLSFDEEAVTAIDGIRSNEPKASQNFYNLQGQRVSLPKQGVYVVEGKKVLVK